jgi:hypothetical protein
MASSAVPIVCARCGSHDVFWLGETRASVFVRCDRCRDVWRLDPLVDYERIDRQRLMPPLDPPPGPAITR